MRVGRTNNNQSMGFTSGNLRKTKVNAADGMHKTVEMILWQYGSLANILDMYNLFSVN